MPHAYPPLADIQERTAASFARQQVMHTMGIRLAAVSEGRVVLHMHHAPALTQQHGFLHAGVVSTALDSACGYAAFTGMPNGAAVLTIEFKVNLLSPARGPEFEFEGVVVKPGRTINVVEGRAWQHGAASDRRLVATMTATVMTVTGREGMTD